MRDFDQFAAGSSDELLRTAYLIVWDLAEAEDLVHLAAVSEALSD